MKHILRTNALMGLVMMLAGAVVVACQKDPLDEFNPKTETIAEAGFSLKGKETRSDGTYVLPWTISKGGVMDSELEELDELAITPFNTFTFEAVPESASATFPGINAKTDNAYVKLECKGQNSFSISYVSDGDATIKVWNGNEGGNTAVTFKVQARKTIPVEGLLVRIDGEEYTIKAVTAPTWQELYKAMRDNPFYTVPYLSGDKIQYVEGVSRFSYYTKEEVNPLKVEILHLVPENTTYRRLNFSEANGSQISEMFCAGEYKWFSEARDGNSYKIPNGTDASILYGRSIFTGSTPGASSGENIKTACPPGWFFLFQFKASGNQDNYTGAYALANTIKTGPAE